MSMYLLLYHAACDDNNILDKMNEDAELTRWQMEICNSLIDGGSPTTKGMKITKDAAEPLLKLPVTNYCIIEAQNKKEAVELSRGAPVLHSGGTAEVYEIAEAA